MFFFRRPTKIGRQKSADDTRSIFVGRVSCLLGLGTVGNIKDLRNASMQTARLRVSRPTLEIIFLQRSTPRAPRFPDT